jgi:hypothetical protein
VRQAGDPGKDRSDPGANGRIGDLPLARVEDDLIDVARLGGKGALQQILRALGLGSLQRELVGRARAHGRRDGERGDEQDKPGDQGAAPVLDAPARNAGHLTGVREHGRDSSRDR